MKPLIALATLLLLAPCVQAGANDAKKLARFEVGFASCEKRFAHMRGHTDEAYLSLWRVRADAKTRGQLATLRKGAVYKKERELALKEAQKSPTEEAKLKMQCEATWAETLRNRPATAPRPASAASK